MSILGVQYYLAYGLAFVLGLTILLVFSLEKFDKPYPGNKYLNELLPSNLSPGSSYIKAFLVYFVIIAGLYAAACVFFSTATGLFDVLFGNGAGKRFGAQPVTSSALSPDASNVSKQAPNAPAEVPLIIALLMVGLFPKYRQFGEIEAPIRRFAHRLIGIPQGLEDQASEIAVTPLALSTQSEPDDIDRATAVRIFIGYRLSEMAPTIRDKLADHLGLPELRAPISDGKKSKRNKEENGVKDKELTDEERELWRPLLEELKPALRAADKWHRTTRLVNRIRQELGSERTIIDQAARKKYEKLRNDIKKSYDEIKSEIMKAESEQKKLIELTETLSNVQDGNEEAISTSDLAEVIDSLRVLMQKRLEELAHTEERLDEILDKAHLYIAGSLMLKSRKVEDARLMGYYGLRNPGIVIWTSIDDVLLAILWMVGLLFVFNFGLYQTLRIFSLTDDNPSLTALRLTVSALAMHGAAAIIAFAWRRRWQKSKRADTEIPQRHVLGYLGLGLTVYVVVYSGLLAWAIISLVLSPKRSEMLSQILWFLANLDLAIALAVLSLSAVGTAVFTALYIEQGERSRLSTTAIGMRAVVQGLLTAFIVLVSSQIQLPGDTYFAVTSCLNGFVVGTTLGAAVLKLASKKQSMAQSGIAAAAPARS